jgi:hypothetical protein
MSAFCEARADHHHICIGILIALLASRSFAQGNAAPTIEISSAATPGEIGFSTYFFNLTPALGSSITAVDGEFVTDTADAMRQSNPFNLPTVFSNNNGAIVQAGEDPLADSQFEFHSNDAILVIDTGESGTELRAVLGGLRSPLTDQFTLAHVVLADGAVGTWRIGSLQRDAGGVEREYSQSGVFGFSVGAVRGDYNADGNVDAADYVLWRDTVGLTGTGLAADGNMNAQIDVGDYDLWRANFGRGAAGSAFAIRAVPEPARCVMILVWTAVAVTLGNRMQLFQGRMHIRAAHPG